MIIDKRLMLHTTIYCSTVSPCGKFLAVGNNYGHILIFKLNSALIGNADKSARKPIFLFQAHEGPVHSLQSADNVLISGGCGAVSAWFWADITRQKVAKAWSLENSCLKNSSKPDCVNSILYTSKDKTLYLAGDNGAVSLWDIKTGKKLETYFGHSDYVHDLALLPNGLASASEDGTVKIWDQRNAECTDTIKPHEKSILNRQKYGKWISCVTADEDGEWLVCGGGPQLGLFHRRSMNLIKPLEEAKHNAASITNHLPNVVNIFRDEIISGGNSSMLFRWYMNGDAKAEIPCSVNSIFSMTSKTDADGYETLPLMLTGADYKVDVFTNLGYLGCTLTCV